MNQSGMGVIPAGGLFKFAQRLPNGNYYFFTDLLESGLVKQVIQYRVNNNLPVGDVAAEVNQYLEGNKPKPLGETRSLRERVTNWKINRSLKPLEFVTQEQADERALICADCPFNQVKYADDCKECYSTTTRDLFAMRKGKTTPSDPWLGACQITGQDNVTAVHLDDDNLNYKVNFIQELSEKYPKCWLLDKPKLEEVE
jgi:hypothetical protein